jgi:hypothetical protein
VRALTSTVLSSETHRNGPVRPEDPRAVGARPSPGVATCRVCARLGGGPLRSGDAAAGVGHRQREWRGGQYQYDPVGNLQNNPTGSFTYTPFDLLETAAPTAASVTTYRDDGSNQRVSRIGPGGPCARGLRGTCSSKPFVLPMASGWSESPPLLSP